MANSGIKVSEQAKSLANQLKEAISSQQKDSSKIKGFFLAVDSALGEVVPVPKGGNDASMSSGVFVMDELISRFTDKDPQYGVVSFEVQLAEAEQKRVYILFISWVPDLCKVKPKMVASSTLDSAFNEVGKILSNMIKVTINSREDLTMNHLLDNRKCDDGIRVFDGKKIKGKKGSYKYVSDSDCD